MRLHTIIKTPPLYVIVLQLHVIEVLHPGDRLSYMSVFTACNCRFTLFELILSVCIFKLGKVPACAYAPLPRNTQYVHIP
jgi:hypothetical protein